MQRNINCPSCLSNSIKKNGHIHNGKQNHLCKDCGRQFVLDPKNKRISEKTKEKIKSLFMERISLRGIERVYDISITWILNFFEETIKQTPDNLNIKFPEKLPKIIIGSIGIEMDECWSFVGKKTNKCWLWVAIEPASNQIIAFHAGKRDLKSAKALWKQIPSAFRKYSDFCTDNWESYNSIIPEERHFTHKGFTQNIERFFNTLRQRLPRLVRKTLSFSKKWSNHINLIRYFIADYNLKRQKALLL